MRRLLEMLVEYQWISRKLAHENVDRDHRGRRPSYARELDDFLSRLHNVFVFVRVNTAVATLNKVY